MYNDKELLYKAENVRECGPGSERYDGTRNGVLMLKCTCAECGITKVSNVGETKKPIWEGRQQFIWCLYDSHSVGETLLKSGLNAATL